MDEELVSPRSNSERGASPDPAKVGGHLHEVHSPPLPFAVHFLLPPHLMSCRELSRQKREPLDSLDWMKRHARLSKVSLSKVAKGDDLV